MKNEHSNKKSNVTTLVPAGVQSLLEKFAQSKELTDFLPLIEIVATTSIACPQVWDVWLRLNGSVKASQPTQAILETIARLSWHQIKQPQNPSTNDNALVSNHSTQNNDSSKFSSFFKAVKDQHEYMQARLTDLDDPYRFFPAAWPFDKIFAEKENFGSEDPGKIISKYLCAFYSAPITPTVADLLIEVRQSSLLCFLKDSLLPWAIAFERRNLLNQNTDEAAYRTAQLAEIEIFIPHLFGFLEGKIKLSDPSTFASGFTVRGFAKALPNLPQSMFERMSDIESDIFNYGAGDSIELGYPELFDVLLSLPLDAPFHSWDIFEAEVLPNSFLRQASENIYSIDSLPYLPIRLLGHIVFAFAVDYSIAEDAAELDDSNCSWALNTERLRELYERLIGKITDVRRLHYGGKSPLNYFESGWLGSNLGSLCDGNLLKIDHDLTYLLSETDDMGMGFYGEEHFSACFNASELSSKSAKLRTQIYLQVIGLLRKEGWHEFANACLAFYLFSQPIYSKDHQLHADWSILGKAMKEGASLPGWHVVEESLDFACTLISKGDPNSLDALCMASWLPHKTRHIKAMSPDIILSSVLNHSQAEKDLKEFLGNETWIKLTPEGKRRLIDADAEWSALHPQLGKGRHDWGSVATAYGKVFEGELASRMKSVFSSQSYDTYCRTKNRKSDDHITLGPMLHLLKEFTDLDQPLRDEIEKTGIHIQEDKELIKNLLSLTFDRNRGAHPAGLTAKQFVDFRTLIFQGGVLKKFINLL